MRAGRKSQAVRVTTALFALVLFAGCRVPGASFGTEPLQLRFSTATQRAIAADAAEASPHRRVPHGHEPVRESLAEPIVLASNEASHAEE